MDQATTSLTSMWVTEGQVSPLKPQPSTPSKSLGTDIVGDEVINFYEEAGLESIAREAKLIDSSSRSVNRRDVQQVARVVQLPQLISPKPSPMKTTTQILPKVATIVTTTNINAVPMILGTSQRQGSTILANSPQAQYVGTPIQIQSPSWSNSQKRKADFSDEYSDNGSSKRKKREKESKGLRHFSMKVCEKVQKKGVTSYNEVADELVREFSQPAHQFLPPSEQHQYDQKNIRRRVYDALNVLMAMNIISKEKKEIHWIGLPTNSRQECDKLETEKKARLERIRQKKSQLQELILQQIAFKNLVTRNKRLEESGGSSPPTTNSAIHLPYIIVNTSKKTVIDCSISNDKYEYLFNFNDTFQIHDDIEVLKRMGMAYGLEKGQCSQSDLERAKTMIPKTLEPYLLDMAKQSQSSATSTSIIAGPSGIQTQGASRPHLPGDPQLSPLAVPLSNDAEVALVTQDLAISQSSSLSSFSDAGPSRGATDTPSSLLDSESDESSRDSFSKTDHVY